MKLGLHPLRLLALPVALLACAEPPDVEAPAPQDLDQDGWRTPQDCDDQDALANPAAPELCDGQDDDCDGQVDEAPVDGQPFAPDLDGDGWGAGATTLACAAPAGYGPPGDCDDGAASAAPGLPESCDGLDNDCDGDVDNHPGAPLWAPDTDGDGAGDTALAEPHCTPPTGWVDTLGDCDDADPARSPTAAERCDGVDNDCDGATDEPDAADAPLWAPDLDGDGWGSGAALAACVAPAGYGAPGDCDDGDAAISPDAAERCDGLDNNCDGLTDDASAVDLTLWARDLDGDGYGDPIWSAGSCAAPAGWVDTLGDCDDQDAAVSPAAVEVCGDGVDNDCDGLGGPACGPVGVVDLGGAAALLGGLDTGDAAGAVLAAGGDLNGDGVADLLVGTPQRSHDSRGDGAAWALLGPFSGSTDLSAAGAVLVGAERGSAAGTALAFVGDLSGDGRDELLIGASNEDANGRTSGAVYLVLGGVSGERSLSAAYARYLGEASEDWAGGAVGAADLDGDGTPDVAVGAAGNDRGGSGAGAVFLLSGGPAGEQDLADADAVLVGEAAGDRAGAALATPGDLDGDGVQDLLIGAWGHDGGGGNAGAAYLLLGPLSGTLSLADADLVLEGEASNDYAAAALAGAGDLDGDGYSDWAVSARSQDRAAEDAGLVYVFYGPPTSGMTLATADATLLGTAAFDYAGYAVAPAGDNNGDGLDDLLVGAHYADGSGTDSGVAYLVLGPLAGSTSLADADATLQGAAASDLAGAALAGAGDQDGDGLPELWIGAPGAGSGAGAVVLVLGGAGL